MNGRTHQKPLAAALGAVAFAVAACAAPAAPAPAAAPQPTVRLSTPVLDSRPATPVPQITHVAGGGPGTAAPVDVDASVEQLAQDWLVAYRSASYTAAADAWIDHVTPYSTTDLAAQFQALRAAGRGPGLSWQTFVGGRCTAQVADVAAVIPPEAPRTGDTIHVQAAGVLRTSCATGPDQLDEPLAVTLTAARTAEGWLIASRDN